MDTFSDDRERWEMALAWLREYGPSVLLSVAIVGLGLAGWRYWQARNERYSLTAADRYEQVLSAFGHNDLAGGLKLADELIKDYPRTPYADQADLAAARIAVENGQLDQAASRLRHVLAVSRDSELQLLARLRLARVQLAQGHADEALQTLNIPNPGAFTARYDEVRGDALLAKGDRAGALKAYQAAHAHAGDTLDSGLLELKIDNLARS